MNSHQKKLIDKLVNNIDAVDLSDCQIILEMFGWIWKPGPGSHRLFRKRGEMPFCLPTLSGRGIKKVYKIKLRDFLEERYPQELEL